VLRGLGIDALARLRHSVRRPSIREDIAFHGSGPSLPQEHGDQGGASASRSEGDSDRLCRYRVADVRQYLYVRH
jgi:hypothetical protein